MYHRNAHFTYFVIIVLCLYCLSCSNSGNKDVTTEKKLVTNPNEMDKVTTDNIKEALVYALKNAGKMDDSITLKLIKTVDAFYKSKNYEPVWSTKATWKPLADSLFSFLENAELQGLFSNEYHNKNLQSLKKKLDNDSLNRMDAVLWSKADMMLTDGFMYAIYHLKHGRLQADSLSLNKDSILAESFFASTLNRC